MLIIGSPKSFGAPPPLDNLTFAEWVDNLKHLSSQKRAKATHTQRFQLHLRRRGLFCNSGKGVAAEEAAGLIKRSLTWSGKVGAPYSSGQQFHLNIHKVRGVKARN